MKKFLKVLMWLVLTLGGAALRLGTVSDSDGISPRAGGGA